MRLVNEIWKNSREHLRLQLSTVIVMSLCFASVFILSLIAKNVESGLGNWSEDLEMSVYLSEDIDEKEKSKVEEALSHISEVKKFKYIDKEQAKSDFKEKVAKSMPSLFDESIGNPFPSSYELELNSISNTANISSTLETLKNKILNFDGVEDVGYGQYWLDSYKSTVGGIRSSVSVVALILSLASLLIIGNTIRAQVYQKKEEVEILELIGATSKWIRLPFLVSGGVVACVAAVLGLGVSGLGFYLAKEYFQTSLGLLGVYDNIKFFGLLEIMGFIGLCALIGAIGSYLCVRNINNGFAASGGK